MSPFSWLYRPFEHDRSCYSGNIFPFCTDNFYGHDSLWDGNFFSGDLASLLGLSLLSGIDWGNKSTGSDSNKSNGFYSFPLESFNILVRLLDGDTFRYGSVKCQFLEFEFQKL